MQEIDLGYLCTTMSNLAGVPIRLYKGEKLLQFCFGSPLPADPAVLYRAQIDGIREHVGYFITPQFDYYGIVNAGATRIVLGPTRQTAYTDRELQALAFRADVPQSQAEAFVQGMKSILRLPLDSVMQILCTVNHVLNGEKLGLEDIAIHTGEQLDLKAALAQQRAQQKLQPPPGGEGQQNAHGTLALEQALTGMVRRGDTAALQQWLAAAPAVRGGVLAAGQLRQQKNIFIVTATLITRAAIQGGLDAEEAFALSDGFIQSCELLTSSRQIVNLQYRMVLEFTEQVEQLRLGGRDTALVRQVTQYVRRHLSQPVSVEQMARALYISRPYLSLRFRQQTGETLTDFILREKTEEAKRLLRYTDKSAVAIGGYLGFSSQGHFCRVFKKYAGCTPGAYRAAAQQR